MDLQSKSKLKYYFPVTIPHTIRIFIVLCVLYLLLFILLPPASALYTQTCTGANITYCNNASGGTITQSGGYTIHTFTSNGIFVSNTVAEVSAFVIGGGGSGSVGKTASYFGSGGGAGVVNYNPSFNILGNVSVVVGDGGAPQTSLNINGNPGQPSSFGTITAQGGMGGYFDNGTGGNSGGYTGGAPNGARGGGGAGSGENGKNANATNGGDGGNGTYNSITGASVCYGGGGGGTSGAGIGGCGGGGNGFAPGTANTGGGGGAGEYGVSQSGAGGSGVVIVRYISMTALLSSWGNNYTNNDSTSFAIQTNKIINFNASSDNITADTYAWYFNGVNQGVSYNNITLSLTSAIVNNISVVATNTTNGITAMNTWFVSLPFTLSSPANNSVLYFTYPPLTTSVNHTWSTVGYPYYNIQISSDINFAHLVIDDYTSNAYYVRGMENGTWYWRVRDYNSGTGIYGTWSPTSKYTLASTISTTGTGVHGIIYEMIGGVQTPVSGVTVYLYNNTLSQSTITGTNGYYAFTGLADSTTYSVYASKQGYETTAVFPVTTGVGTMQTKDILMKIYISPYVPNFVFEKFIVRGWFDVPFSGVTVNVYKGTDITPSHTGLTDSMGQVVFQLIKDQYYRVTFSGGGLSSTITRYVYAKEESILISVVMGGFPDGGNRSEIISTALTSTVYNSTYNNLSLVYADSMNTTTLISFYATNITTGETCYRNSTSQTATLSCTVLASGTYRFGFNATSTVYGFFSEDRVINYAVGNTAAPIIPAKTTATLLHWGSVMLIVLTTCLFSIRTVKIGVVIVPGLALVVWAVGWLQAPILLLSVAMALGVLVYMRASEVKVNY